MSSIPAVSSAAIDIKELGDACRPLLRCYREICNGADPLAIIRELDQALLGIKALPPLPGRIGRAIAVLASGGRPGFPQATVAALEVLESHSAFRLEASDVTKPEDLPQAQSSDRQLSLF